jgi:protein-tyrosine phosphatase
MPPVPTILDSYWVRPGQLMAGEYPSDWNDRGTRKKLRGLLNECVSFFLDLTEAREYDLKPYAPLLEKEAAALGQGVEHQRMPIQDRGTPTTGQMTRILDTIDDVLAAGGTVYVHCYAGIGRTGTVVGCYLVRHGITGEEALAEIPRLRRDMWGGWVSSPETAAQRAMVREWPVGS